DIYPITYQAIQNTQADVLVLSGSGYYYTEPIGTELDDEETEAIERWVREGHGFVAIGTAFHQNVSNNNALVNLVGIADRPYATNFSWEIEVFPECLGHPLFRNVSSQFSISFNRTASPSNDHEWNVSDLNGGTMCARSIGNWPPPPAGWGGPVHTSAIVKHKGAVLIAFAADVMPNFDEKQLLYNAFTWSKFEVFDYDIEVSTNAPRFAAPFNPVNIRSRVANIGLRDLSTVRVDLKVNGNVIDTKNISSLPHLESADLYFTWTPSSLGTYQICTYAEIVSITDEDPSNNEACMPVEVTDDVPVQIYVLDSWGTDFAHLAPWDYLTQNWNNHGNVRIDINYTRFNKERIAYDELVDSYADVLLISSSRSGDMSNPAAWGYYFGDKELNAIRTYTQEGHGLMGTGLTLDSEKLRRHGQVLGPPFGLKAANLYYYLDGVNDLSIINPVENHPLFYNISVNYDTNEGLTLTPGLLITWFPLPKPDEWYPLNWTSERLDGGEYKSMSYPDDNATVIAHDPGGYK
ncbi:MAG: hypothetical protein KAW09_07050, partial [Thermoplasmata archaeon]|nr:hypothetical protein [Thermoplasmata archaeon]